MKKLLLVVLVAGFAWWHFIGGRKLTEDHVREFYRNLELATLARNPEALCLLLADDFVSSGTVAIGGQQRAGTYDKTQTCDGYRDVYAVWEKLGEAMGGVLQLDSDYKINSIELAADKKSAVVDFSSSLDVAGSIANIRCRGIDTLVRRNGRVLMLRSEGSGSVSAGS